MRLKVRYLYFLLPTLLFKCIATIPVQAASDFVEESLRVRVRRQDGYVYDKPSVSFHLPQKSTPAPTQAPNVDRTLTQQMFYAYPVPAGGDTVNIGQTSGTTTTAATASPAGTAGGYSYKSVATGNAGYNYGTSSSGAQVNTGVQVTSTGSQTTVTGTQSATNSGTSTNAASGYTYNAASPMLSPTLQGSSDVSTSAPKYLPPTGGSVSGSTTTAGSVGIGGVSVTSGSGQVTTGGTTTSVQTGSVGTPSDTYLPPLGTTNTATSGQTVTSKSTKSQTNTGGSVDVPSSSYLPPNTSSGLSPAPSPGYTSSQPAAPPQPSYIPPSRTNTGTVSTPASTYLPPSFF